MADRTLCGWAGPLTKGEKGVLMRGVRLLSLVWVLSASMLACSAHADRTITVNATVLNAAGQPLDGVPLLVVTERDSFFGRTDSAGASSIQASVLDTENKIAVTFAITGDPTGTAEQVDADIARYTEVVGLEAFPDEVPLPIDPNTTIYAVQLQGRPAIHVSGRIVDGSGQPVRGAVNVLGQASKPVFVGANGAFTLQGVPRGDAVDLMLSLVRSNIVHPVRLEASATQSDVQLGDVQLAVPSGMATTITMLNRQAVAGGLEDLSDSVTAMAADGTLVGFYFVNSNGMAGSASGAATPVTLPAGTYYICPGNLDAQETPRRLWRAIRAGQDLTNSGVPGLVVTEGTPASITFDAAAAVAAVRALP